MAERVGQGPYTEWYDTTDVVLQATVAGEAHPRWVLTADGTVATGDGTVAPVAGPVYVSANGHRWNLAVDNTGTITATDLDA